MFSGLHHYYYTIDKTSEAETPPPVETDFSSLDGTKACFDATVSGTVVTADYSGTTRVSSWTDALGGGYTFTEASIDSRRPTLTTSEGISTLSFSRSNSERLYSSSGSINGFTNGKTGLTMTIVLKTSNYGTQMSPLAFRDNANSAPLADARLNQDSYVRPFYKFGATSGNVKGDSVSTEYGVNERQYLGITNFQMITINFDAANGQITTWKNGYKGYTDNVTASNFEALNCSDVSVGSSSSSQFWDGEIALIFLRDKASTDAEIRTIHSQIEARLGLSLVITKLIYFIGDSIIATTSITDNQKRPHVLLEASYNTPTVGVVNRGIGGANSYDLSNTSRFDPTTVDDWWNDYTGVTKQLYMAIGTNDTSAQVTGGPSNTEADFISRFNTAITGYSNAGITVVVATMIARDDTGITNPAAANKITSLNSKIRTQLTDADAIADIGAATQFIPANYATVCTDTNIYDPDKLHTVDGGYVVMVPLIKTALDSV